MAQTFFGYILRAWSQSQVQHCVAQTFFYQQKELIIFRANVKTQMDLFSQDRWSDDNTQMRVLNEQLCTKVLSGQLSFMRI
jgi:hypothetical protein